MHILDMTIVLAVNIETTNPIILTCSKVITIPFPPFTGMVITLSRMGQEMGGDFVCEEVVWDHLEQRFLGEYQRAFDDAGDANEALRDYVAQGWMPSEAQPDAIPRPIDLW